MRKRSLIMFVVRRGMQLTEEDCSLQLPVLLERKK